MTVTRWHPWDDLFSGMDHLVSETLGRSLGQSREGHAVLPLDIRQTDDTYLIEASLPGFDPKEVEVTLDEGMLTIKAEHRAEERVEKGDYVRRERRQSSVFRQVGLPAEVRPDGISAAFENGVLSVTVPRAQKAQPRRIPVGSTAVIEAGSQSR